MKEYAERMLGKKVEIREKDMEKLALTLEMPEKIRIIMKKGLSNEEKMVVLAHEISHIFLKSPRHDMEHDRLMRIILSDLAAKFSLNYAKLLLLKKKLDVAAGLI